MGENADGKNVGFWDEHVGEYAMEILVQTAEACQSYIPCVAYCERITENGDVSCFGTKWIYYPLETHNMYIF